MAAVFLSVCAPAEPELRGGKTRIARGEGLHQLVCRAGLWLALLNSLWGTLFLTLLEPGPSDCDSNVETGLRAGHSPSWGNPFSGFDVRAKWACDQGWF